MPFYIEAPHPTPEVTIVLPNPKFDNTAGMTSNITALYSMDGTVYSYVQKRGSKKKYLWSFSMARDKSDELLNFLQVYGSKRVLVDWNDTRYMGYIAVNPVELRTTERAGGFPGGELVTMTIEFQESSL